jgi:AcrR family transcriptional regulator
MDEIARRAGVGVGTIYRRFPSKEKLIAAVAEETARSLRGVLVDSLALEDPAEGFRAWIFGIGQLQLEHRGFLSRLMDVADDGLRTELDGLSQTLLQQAQDANAIRSDLTIEDLMMFFWSLRGVIERTWARSPQAWRRFAELFFASLVPGTMAFEQPPLSF